MSEAVGVDIGGTKVLSAVVDEEGRIIERSECETDPKDGTGSLIKGLELLFAKTDPRDAPIGVGAAAYIDAATGAAVFAPNLDYGDPDIKAVLSNHFGRRVVVENDANAAAWGEFRFGSGRGATNMIMLTIGTGVGGGAIIDGQLYRGSRGFAAEFGHMTILDGGPLCACGQRGCLEAMASGNAMGRIARERVSGRPDSKMLSLADGMIDKITGAIVDEAAEQGDKLAIDVLAEVGRNLGVGLANLANIFDPDLIVIGGGGARAGEALLGPARRELAARFEGRVEPARVVQATLGNEAGVVGAADLARTNLA